MAGVVCVHWDQAEAVTEAAAVGIRSRKGEDLPPLLLPKCV